MVGALYTLLGVAVVLVYKATRVVSLAQEYRVHGVVSQVIRSCIPCLWQQPLLRERLLSRGIPILELDEEYGTAGGGQTRTRVQAFLESLHMKEL